MRGVKFNMPNLAPVDVAVLLLRLVLGPLLVFHGGIKFRQRGGIAQSGRFFESIGLRPGLAHAWAAALGLLVTGGCLSVGVLTPFAGLGTVGLMTVAGWTVRRGHGPLATSGGWEYCLVVAAVGVAVATTGPGTVSLDELLGMSLGGWSGLMISAGGGLGAAAVVLTVFYERPAVPSEVPAGRNVSRTV